MVVGGIMGLTTPICHLGHAHSAVDRFLVDRGGIQSSPLNTCWGVIRKFSYSFAGRTGDLDAKILPETLV